MVCFKIVIIFEDKALVRARPDVYSLLMKKAEEFFSDGGMKIKLISIERQEEDGRKD